MSMKLSWLLLTITTLAGCTTLTPVTCPPLPMPPMELLQTPPTQTLLDNALQQR